jgi:hypothetical protein
MADVTDTFYPSEAIHGYGAQWLIGAGNDTPGPETFSAVAQVKTITPGEMSTETIDKTHLRSPEAHREHRAGLRDTGPFAVQCIWDPRHESQSNAGGGSGAFADGGLVFLWRTRAERNMKIIIPNGDPDATPVVEETEWPFRGVITKCQPGEIGEDGVIMLDVEIQPLMDISADLP